MRIVGLLIWMLAAALILAGCTTGGLVLEDDDAVADDDDTGDDDTGDDDTGDDDTADDDTGDDDTSEGPVSFTGSADIFFIFYMTGEPMQIDCFADMVAEMDAGHTVLDGTGMCLLDVPYVGEIPGDLILTTEVMGQDVFGEMIFIDPTGGWLQDLPFEIDGMWDADEGSVFSVLHASYPDVVEANGELMLQAL